MIKMLSLFTFTIIVSIIASNQASSPVEIVADAVTKFSYSISNITFRDIKGKGNTVSIPLNMFEVLLQTANITGADKDEIFNALFLPKEMTVSEALGAMEEIINQIQLDYSDLSQFKSNRRELSIDERRSNLPNFLTSKFKHHVLSTYLNKLNDMNEGKKIYSELVFEESFKNFEKTDRTVPAPSGNGRTISLLSSLQDMQYYKDSELKFEALTIPYMNEKFVMHIILPNEDQDFRKFVENFQASNYKELLEKLNQQNSLKMVNASFPEMLTDWRGDISQQVKEMGINQIFQDNLFDKISASFFVKYSTRTQGYQTCRAVYANGTVANQNGKHADNHHVGGKSKGLSPMHGRNLKSEMVQFLIDNKKFYFLIYSLSVNTVLNAGIITDASLTENPMDPFTYYNTNVSV